MTATGFLQLFYRERERENRRVRERELERERAGERESWREREREPLKTYYEFGIVSPYSGFSCYVSDLIH